VLFRSPTSFDLTDAPPVDLCGVSILLVAGHHTTLATDAFSHVEMKAILLAGLERALRNADLGCIEGSVVRARAALIHIGIQDEGDTVFACSLDERQWHQACGGPRSSRFIAANRNLIVRTG